MRVTTLALWLTLGFGAVAPTPAHADVASFQTVEGIFNQCNKGDAFCYGFVGGAVAGAAGSVDNLPLKVCRIRRPASSCLREVIPWKRATNAAQ
jgi:hypothetical protein